VDGGSGNDMILVGGYGNDTVYGNDIAEFAMVYGEDGDDDIDVFAYDGTVDGGSGNDVIDVWYGVGSGGEDDSGFVVLGDDGDDAISTHSGTFEVTGGAGNDTITLTNNVNYVDTLVFGDIGYGPLQQETVNSQGVDQIKDYNWEFIDAGDPAPLLEDVMDFSAFFDGSPLGGGVGNARRLNETWTHDTTFNASPDPGNSLVVLSTTAASLDENGLALSAADFSRNQDGTIRLNDNARAVVVIGIDETGPASGIDNFQIYFVQDIDSGAGQTWQVDLVATVDSATLVGVQSVYDNLTAFLV
jgi:hypothetical protein